MSNLEPVSPKTLYKRRQQLRQQRRWNAIRTLWQFFIVASLAGGTGWLMSRPGWIIHDSSAIEIEGTFFLAPDMVRSQLPIDYPKSLVAIPTDQLEAHLKSLDPIADVVIHRQLFPPRLTVQLQEHHPVALLVGNSYTERDSQLYQIPQQQSSPFDLDVTGFIDANGTWLPLTSYQNNTDTTVEELPTLRIIGMRRSYREQWSTLYQQIQQSPVTVTEINWQQIDNLILKTEIGTTYHGPYLPTAFAQQLQTIDQMRSETSQLDPSRVRYIDLRSAETPLIQYYDSLS
ncbi:MAG: FtsQ-type POTRA domain-containing protein, partial [Merismopedia sp. SIO2A8]|nr:FtsQ-type POTRA domain-containing protein [Merismopedia sp. SIO2A8]